MHSSKGSVRKIRFMFLPRVSDGTGGKCIENQLAEEMSG